MEAKSHGTAPIIEQYVSVTTKPATERTPGGEVKEEDNEEKTGGRGKVMQLMNDLSK